MKVNYQNTNTSFKGLYNNRFLKRGLEFAADNGALFAASTELALSLGVRPLSILATPKTDKDNKKIACAKSLTSSFTNYLVMLLFSKPVSRAMKRIDNNPARYLSENTIKTLKNGEKVLSKSKAYTLATQLFKLGLGLVIACPKATLTALGVPVVLNKIFPKTSDELSQKPSFEGRFDLSKQISKVINNPKFQNFAVKHENSNFPMHIVASTDALSTATFIGVTGKSDKIKTNKKKTLMLNSAIATGLSIVSGYTIDKLLTKPTEKFIENFKKANADLPKLDKYADGIKIVKPILILGGLYYTIIPVISTFISDKIFVKDKTVV